MVAPPFVGFTVKVSPLQIVGVWVGMTGLGLTLTVTVNVFPTQVPEVGVTVYVAFSGVLVLLVRVPVMFAPLPDDPPLRPAGREGAVQV
tara:strand:- start:89 stop:355 length:267 start_codon:yes stop_codon:yes gene_type:complete